MAPVGGREPEEIRLGVRLLRLWASLVLTGVVLALICSIPAVRRVSDQSWWWTMGLWALGSLFFTAVEVQKWRLLRPSKPSPRGCDHS